MEREEGERLRSGAMEVPAGECLDTIGGAIEHGHSDTVIFA
jgi:hypothetical protein